VTVGIPGGGVAAVAGVAAAAGVAGVAEAAGRPGVLPSRLIWVGRMERPKGGDLFLRALAPAARVLGRDLTARMFGDGRERARWERLAGRLHDGSTGVRVSFPGWVNEPDLQRALAEADLLVVSSTWPEPYGRVGLEAGWHGVPVAAFAVGGVPEWLEDGVNGFLAPGEPPSAPGLADAIVRCLDDPDRHAGLRAGAREVAKRLTFARHAADLERVFHRVLHRD
jgi:glycosyltransferase involved in cell wall biosynthesis